MSFKVPVVFALAVFGVLMVGTIAFFASYIDFTLKDDKEPVALFFLFIAVVYALTYFRLCWACYKNEEKGVVVVTLLIGMAYAGFCIWTLFQ